MDSASESEILCSVLERLRRTNAAQADVDALAQALKEKKIAVSGSRGVGIGTAQDAVIITGDNNEYRSIELTFNGPQAGAIRMAIGRAQMRNAELADLPPRENAPGPPMAPPGTILTLAVGLIFSTGAIRFLSDPFFREGWSFVGLLIMGALGLMVSSYSVRQIVAYRMCKLQKFPCQVIDKRESGTVAFDFTLEDVNQNRYYVTTKKLAGEGIGVGDVGVAIVKSTVLLEFNRFDL